MIYKTIVLIFDTPALETEITTYSLNEIINLDYKLVILDASPVLMPKANKIVTGKRINHSNINSYICQSYKQLEFYIKEFANNACFIPMFNCYYDVRKVFSLLTKYNVFYGHVTTARVEVDPRDTGTFKRSWKQSRLNPIYCYKAVYYKVFRKLIRYKKADFLVLGGLKHKDDIINAIIFGNKTKIIKLHTWDYERFLNADKYDNNGKPYCVYLDQFFPFHPDIVTQLGNIFDEDDKKQFLKDMNSVFNYIRNTYGLEVIIAAHPRADYNSKPEYYPNIKIEYGLTASLVKGASLVIANFSNSIMFAVMADLPLIIVNSSIIKKCDYFYKVMQGFVNFTGALAIDNVSELPITKDSIIIHKEKYNSLRENFIQISPSNDKSMWQNIFDSI